MNVHEWLEYGVEKGYCTPVCCATHDGIPDTEEEQKAWDEGYDPCAPIVRLWEPDERTE